MGATRFDFYSRTQGAFVRRAFAGSLQAMRDAVALSPTDIWFVGDRDGPGLTVYGSVQHFDGVTVQEVPTPLSPTTTPLFGVCASSLNNIWVVGDSGKILRYNGLGWANVASGTTRGLYDIWCSGASVFAVGESATLLRWNGNAFVAQPAPTGFNSTLTAISGTSANDVWAVGDDGSIVHFDGTSWTKSMSPTTEKLRAVLAFSANDVYASGDDSVLHWDGSVWTKVLNLGSRSLSGTSSRLWLAPNGHFMSRQ